MNYRVYNKAVSRFRYPYFEVAAMFLLYGNILPADFASDDTESNPRPLDKVLILPSKAYSEPTPISMHSNVPSTLSDTD